MFNRLMGRTALRPRPVQDERALALILGMPKGRFYGEDACYRMMSKVPRERARTWLAWSERDLYAALPPGVHRRQGLDGERPPRPSGGHGAGLQPAQARPEQPFCAWSRARRLALYMEWRRGDTVGATHWVEVSVHSATA